jgi:hypothetical protein
VEAHPEILWNYYMLSGNPMSKHPFLLKHALDYVLKGGFTRRNKRRRSCKGRSSKRNRKSCKRRRRRNSYRRRRRMRH